MKTVRVMHAGLDVEGTGPDLENALQQALKSLSRRLDGGQFYVLGRLGGKTGGSHGQFVEMSFSASDTSETHRLFAIDLHDHYLGAIETVRTVANLRHGYAGRTKNALEEVIGYAIGSGKYLQRLSGKQFDPRPDIKRAIKSSSWSREIDVDAIMLRHSA